MSAPDELQVTKYTETHSKTGEPVLVTELQRGILSTRHRQFKSLLTFFEEMGSESPRQNLEKRCDDLRDYLQSKGLPSDRQPRWVQYDDGDWQEKRPDTELPKPAKAVSSLLWIKRLEMLTEPLTPERLAGELLWNSIQLLKQPGIDTHLFRILRFTNSYHTFGISGQINRLAGLGLGRRRDLATGPIAMREKAVKKAKVIMDCANEFWIEHSADRGVASSTAAAIRETVNGRLRAERLLSKTSNGLSSKTIGDYIRRNNGVQIFWFRQIGCGNRQFGIAGSLRTSVRIGESSPLRSRIIDRLIEETIRDCPQHFQ